MIVAPGPCTAHWLCVRQPTRSCGFGGFQSEAVEPHRLPPICMRHVCGRANHRFCDDHKPRGRECLRRGCDQPSLCDEDIIITSGEDKGLPDQNAQYYCSKQCCRLKYSRR
jgi:hypothetical protein